MHFDPYLHLLNIDGSQVIISPQNDVFLSLKIDFVFVNSAIPDEMSFSGISSSSSLFARVPVK